jgi:fatty acid desaturase
MSSKPPSPSSGGKSPNRPTADRQIPTSLSGQKPLVISKIIVALIVAGFVASLAGAIAPLLLGASKWWLVLSFLLLGVSTIACMALREP